MAIFLASFVVIGLIILAMSVGVLLGRSPIQGSCGGMRALGLEMECEICGGDLARCDRGDGPREELEAVDMAYDAAAERPSPGERRL